MWGYGSVGVARVSKGTTAKKKLRTPGLDVLKKRKEPLPLSGLETEIFQPERQSLQQKTFRNSDYLLQLTHHSISAPTT
jgi:hypothetical protein